MSQNHSVSPELRRTYHVPSDQNSDLLLQVLIEVISYHISFPFLYILSFLLAILSPHNKSRHNTSRVLYLKVSKHFVILLFVYKRLNVRESTKFS